MNNNKADISQIRKYLNGELDSRSMHQLEKASQDDPFLMDAMEGYGSISNDQDKDFSELQCRLADRITTKTGKIFSLRFIAIAASLIVVLGIGGVWLMNNRMQQPHNLAVAAQKPPLPGLTAQSIRAKDSTLPDTVKQNESLTNNKQSALAKNQSVKQPDGQTTVNEQIAASLIPNKQSNAIAKASQPNTVQSAGSGYATFKETRADTVKYVKGFATSKKHDSLYFNKPLIAKVPGLQMMPSQGILDNRQKAKMVNGIIITDNSKTETGIITTPQVRPAQVNQPNSAVASEDVVTGYAAQRKKIVAAYSVAASRETKQSADADVSSVVTGQSGSIPVAKSSPVYTPPKAGSRMLTGTVTDKQDGQPIPGAVVKIKGTVAGVVTDANGHFTLRDVDDRATLTVSFIGYSPRVLAVGSADSLHINLSANSNALAEVVVTNGIHKTGPPTEAHPVESWAVFHQYIKTKAISPDGKTGTVKLSFVVNADGKLSGISVIKGLSTATDQKAIELLNDGPAWIGNSNGKTEAVTLKIKF